MKFSFSRKEVRDIVWSTLAIGFIFAYGNNFSIGLFLMMMAVVALSFIPHEMAHKFVAQKYGCFARYEMWKSGLIFALVMTVFFNFAFIAPGAVVIYSTYRDKFGIRQAFIGPKENAYISAAGPITNIMIALLFLPLASANALFGTVVYINSFLAVFNLLPFPPLDGSKIIWYNILLWGAMVAVGVLLVSYMGGF